jgi:dienelactone hydrolase
MAKVGWAGLNVALTAPRDPRGVVIVADGSGDSLFTEGDSEVARTLLDDGFAVVEVRLLARREATADAETSELRFNTGLLADRFADVVAWVIRQPACRDLKIGLYATGTCGAAALRAAARDPESIDAVVCRAPRTEIVSGILGHLCAETLLLLGETDTAHLGEARRAQQLAPPGVMELGVIDGGRPMLEAPAEREAVAQLTSQWFARAFAGAPPHVLHEILADSMPRRPGAHPHTNWRTGP